jgi:hypothetical protein
MRRVCNPPPLDLYKEEAVALSWASFSHTLTPRHHALVIGICLNHLDGTWGNLLSHRACSPPLQALPVLANTSAKAHLPEYDREVGTGINISVILASADHQGADRSANH